MDIQKFDLGDTRIFTGITIESLSTKLSRIPDRQNKFSLIIIRDSDNVIVAHFSKMILLDIEKVLNSRYGGTVVNAELK